MPAKFVVQLRVVIKHLGFFEKVYWRDTVWVSLARAREKFPENEYREVMVQW